ncbi:MAG: RnfH family protein [Gammaproteobacteria bacterium]|nr:RnfH family protein [Gammaproteobacteria bacterium]
MAVAEPIRVEVVCLRPGEQIMRPLSLPAGATVAAAVAAAGLSAQADPQRLGVFGKLCRPDTVLRDGDRVEMYRPLRADPKVLRRRRARGG